MTTTFMASILGIFLVILIKPGDKESNISNPLKNHKNYISTQDTLLDLVRLNHFYFKTFKNKNNLKNIFSEIFFQKI